MFTRGELERPAEIFNAHAKEELCERQ